MKIQDQLTEAMKSAMKAKDSLRLGVSRMARTALKNAEQRVDMLLSRDEDSDTGPYPGTE